MIELIPHKLTAEAFAPYGSVIEPDEAHSFMINEGTSRRYSEHAAVDTGDGDGQTIISLVSAVCRDLPIAIRMMERHPLGSQAFLPAENHRWLVVVADGEKPEAINCRAFLADGHQGVQYNKGTWHHPLLILEERQNFWAVDRSGGGENLEELWFVEGHAVITLEENSNG